MAQNPARRRALADAGIRVLAQEGARGLTHRAVDAEAGVPRGTASNYFPTREDLVAALVGRLGERLTPTADDLAPFAGRTPDRALLGAYLRDVVRRVRAEPQVALALLELRLEAVRRPAVAEALGAWRRAAFADDVAFHTAAGLPGGRTELLLFHYALDGLLLDRLTIPLDPELTVDDTVDELVARLLP
ncbi:TetR/AcrR family transcriptional regulator [Lapillicoccus jejuensis]|uniref:TetR family transcriptional regulator n=1 Tax=Lapillicoccus jejuensis TaxID=402171 RepID=A0A542DYS6_9MICO|nr:TetR/AcrR family transcriptional regulator [Lapillicoccus jejuensis]TQJ08251.1 TetR family transcriptional regulator [Lapillicoccus jejuensis]